MSSYLFFSSPPPASYQTQHQDSFFTPQVHRTNTFTNWSTFQPKLSSPLRTSTFGNIARKQLHNLVQPDLNDTSENAMQDEKDVRQGYLDTPFLGATSSISAQSSEPYFAELPTTQPLPTTTPTDDSSVNTRVPFQFQQRSRDSSASAQISSRITNNRSTRKSAFLDRLRTSRRDLRDSRGIESFEKAEYWRERRAREERMAREARRQGLDPSVLQDEELELETDEGTYGHLSPTDEDKDFAELVDEYYQQNQEGSSSKQSKIDQDFMDDSMDDGFEDDPTYEEAFMEVLTQGSGADQFRYMSPPDQNLSFETRSSNSVKQTQDSLHHGAREQDGDMDVS